MCISHVQPKEPPPRVKVTERAEPAGAAGRGQTRGRRARRGAGTGGGRYLPVAEHQLRAGQAAGPLPDLVGEAEALRDGQHGPDDEHVRPLLHLFLQHPAFPLGQHGVDPTCKTARLLRSGTRCFYVYTKT